MRLAPLLVLLLVTAGVAGFKAANVVPDPVYRVASGSMAPHLPGTHVNATCEQCQFTTMLDAAVELPAEATCSHCGMTSPLIDAEIHPGSILQWEAVPPDQLRRFDLVLLQNLAVDDAYVVKRVAFLPGETPRIAQGELQRGGETLRKSSRERDVLKLLVYDQSYSAPNFHRFQPERLSGSGWDVRPGTLGYVPIAENLDDGADALVYHHRSCLPPPSPSDRDAAPKDSYAYNHSLSRELFPANDLWLEWRFRHWKAEALELTLQGKDAKASIRVDVKRQTVHARADSSEIELPLEMGTLNDATVRAGCCDGMLFLELDQKERHLRFPLIPVDLELSAQPFSLSIEGGPAVLGELKVYRDIVWLGANRRTDPWTLGRKLSPHEIFVLGDNVPISDDSRYEMGPIDVRKHLHGKVLRVISE